MGVGHGSAPSLAAASHSTLRLPVASLSRAQKWIIVEPSGNLVDDTEHWGRSVSIHTFLLRYGGYRSFELTDVNKRQSYWDKFTRQGYRCMQVKDYEELRRTQARGEPVFPTVIYEEPEPPPASVLIPTAITADSQAEPVPFVDRQQEPAAKPRSRSARRRAAAS